MKYQPPAIGIMKIMDTNSCKGYKIDCDCHFDDHSITTFISSEYYDISMETYITAAVLWDNPYSFKTSSIWLYSIYYSIAARLYSFYKKLKITKELWINGYVKYEHTILMNKQQAYNFAETIKQTIEELK